MSAASRVRRVLAIAALPVLGFAIAALLLGAAVVAIGAAFAIAADVLGLGRELVP